MKTLVLSLLLVLTVPLIVLSQTSNTIEYNYDKAGNRILRQAIFVPGIIQSASQKPDSLNVNYFTKSILADSLIVDNISIKIYPNPTYGKFEVVTENYTESDIILYSLHTIAGQKITNGCISSELTQIDLQNHNSGPYIFRLIINGKTNSWRVIKR